MLNVLNVEDESQGNQCDYGSPKANISSKCMWGVRNLKSALDDVGSDEAENDGLGLNSISLSFAPDNLCLTSFAQKCQFLLTG